MMKILVYSDIQYCAWSEFSTVLPNGRNSRLQDQLDVQDRIFQKAIELATTDEVIVVHNGDLFESMTEKIDKSTFLSVYEKFENFSKFSIPTVLLLGNHDWLDKTETKHIIKPFRNLTNVIVADEVMEQFVNGIWLKFIPYTKQGFKEKVNELADNDHQGKQYLFTHQGVNGAMVGPRDIPLKDEFSPNDFRLDRFTVVLNGHYHKPQNFGNLQIVGSPIQRDFGERNDEKGYWVLDTDENPRKPVFFKTKGPKFFKIEVKNESDIVLPEDFTNRDFLWVVSSNVRPDRVDKILGGLENIDPKNVRIEFIKEENKKVRTNISVSDSTELQIKKYLDYCETDLDKERLLTMSLETYKKSN